MNRTREWLRRPAGGVEPRKNKQDESRNNTSGRFTSPSSRKSSQASLNGSSGSGNEEEKKRKQKLTETKLFKRLLQPAQMTTERKSNSVGSASHSQSEERVIPRLGEVPVRSKYYRAEQQNSHFATTADYLPLAEICGPPVQHSRQPQKRGEMRSPHKHKSRSKKHKSHPYARKHSVPNKDEAPYDGMEEYADHGADEEEDGGREADDDEDNYEGQDGMDIDGYNDDVGETDDVDFVFDDLGSVRINEKGNAVMGGGGGGLCEGVVKETPDSARRRSYSSIGSATSAASSIGPTGLALLPQFRWVPRPGGGGHGFNPFMAFQHSQPQQQQQHQQQAPRTHSPTQDYRNLPSTLQASLDEDIASPLSPNQRQQDEGKITAALSTVEARHSSFNMFYCSPSPTPQSNTVTPLQHSFYGPIGSVGVEASHKRRQLELENGVEGDAEKAYKARTARRSASFDNDSILLITKAWCDPDLLLNARVVDSPRWSETPDDDTSSSEGTAIVDWEGSSDDLASGKPPMYDKATMAAREARVRKERIRQERRRYQSSESPSFYFAGEELAALHPPPQQHAEAQRQAVVPLSPPIHQRAPLVKTKPPSSPSKAVECDQQDDASSTITSDKSSENSGDDDDDNDSNTDSDSDFGSDRSSNSDSDEEEKEDYRDSDGNRSPHDKSVTQAPTHKQRMRLRGRAVPPDISISVVGGTTMGRSVVVGGDAGRYDFMNSSMIAGLGDSLLFPHDENEVSIVGTTAMAPLTPPHRPGGKTNGNNNNVLPQIRGNQSKSTEDRSRMVGLPLAPKSPISNISATVSAASGKGEAATERPVSGNGVFAANALREKKRAKMVVAAGSCSNSESPQAGFQQRRISSASVNNFDIGAGDLSVYGSSFHLSDARPLYSPTDDTISCTNPEATGAAHAQKSSSANHSSNKKSKRKENSNSPADYTIPGRDSRETSAAHSTSASTLAQSNVQSRISTVSPSSPNRNIINNNSNSNNNGRRISSVPPAVVSMGTIGYNNHPSSVVPVVSLVPSPVSSRTHEAHNGNSHMTTTSAGAGTGKQKAGNYTGEFESPMTPPDTPGALHTPRHNFHGKGRASAAPRASTNMSTTSGLGESAHFNDQTYELPGVS